MLLRSGKLAHPNLFCSWLFSALCLLAFLGGLPALSQEKTSGETKKEQTQELNHEELKVNWFYGAYVPKDVPLLPLTGHQRVKLFVRQTFTTPGIYLKSSFLGLLDQAS